MDLVNVSFNRTVSLVSEAINGDYQVFVKSTLYTSPDSYPIQLDYSIGEEVGVR
jgi:hypothetical protein